MSGQWEGSGAVTGHEYVIPPLWPSQVTTTHHFLGIGVYREVTSAREVEWREVAQVAGNADLDQRAVLVGTGADGQGHDQEAGDGNCCASHCV